ncbi:MAG: hypothetical protein AAGU16_11870 [Desulfitobacterium hafniense]
MASISLSDSQSEILSQLSAEFGISVAELVQRVIAQMVFARMRGDNYLAVPLTSDVVNRPFSCVALCQFSEPPQILSSTYAPLPRK